METIIETTVEATDEERVEDYRDRLADAFRHLNEVKRELYGLHDEGVDLEVDLGDGYADELGELTCHVAFACDAVGLAWNVWDNCLPC